VSPHEEALIEKARQALASAHLLVEHGDPGGAVNRAYYATYYAATAALLAEGEAPKTHAGTQRRFHGLYGEAGRLPSSLASFLKYAYNVRQRADYEAFAVTDAEAAAALVSDAERFVDAVSALLAPG
jgi:uncharacterized protein